MSATSKPTLHDRGTVMHVLQTCAGSASVFPWRSTLLRWSCGAALLLSAVVVRAAEPMQYIYPPPESGADVRMQYYWDLLDAALKVTTDKYGPYIMATSPRVMNASRAEIFLINSTEITVTTRTTSADREKVLLPIRIPLDKGLTGYRLFLIQQGMQQRLSEVRTLKDLSAFSIGQGNQWVDTEVLKTAGLTVVTGGNYDTLFMMLSAGRFDIFSRGVNEIGKEWASGKLNNPQLAIEKDLLLYYPLPRYYFFSRTPEGEVLARRVEDGLRTLKKNGEFERRYQAFKKEILAGLALSGRRLFVIDNPILSPQTPLKERDLWDNLGKELKAPVAP